MRSLPRPPDSLFLPPLPAILSLPAPPDIRSRPVAFGIPLASLVVSSILVPALTALAGQRAWWPRGSARRSAAKPRVEEVVPQATS